MRPSQKISKVDWINGKTRLMFYAAVETNTRMLLYSGR